MLLGLFFFFLFASARAGARAGADAGAGAGLVLCSASACVENHSRHHVERGVTPPRTRCWVQPRYLYAQDRSYVLLVP